MPGVADVVVVGHWWTATVCQVWQRALSWQMLHWVRTGSYVCVCVLCLLFLPVLSLGIFCVVHFPSLFFLFPTTTCLSFVVCFAFVDRGHKQLHVALHQQKGDSGGFRLKTGRGYGGGLCSEWRIRFTHSFFFTSPYILIWPRKCDFLCFSFWTPLLFPSWLSITLSSLKW